MRLLKQRKIPTHAVERPDLLARLDAGVETPLSLVVAPAGGGKTVLLSQWVVSRPDLSIAWVDVLTVGIGAPDLAEQIVREIESVAPDFHAPVAPVDSASGRLGEPFLEDLAAGMAHAGPLVVVFDDLDHLEDSALVNDLWRLVDLLPPSAHVVFSSRIDLQLGWSRHRLQHSLVEIRERDLAFDVPTTMRVLHAITRRPVSEETAAAVVKRTEGGQSVCN